MIAINELGSLESSHHLINFDSVSGKNVVLKDFIPTHPIQMRRIIKIFPAIGYLIKYVINFFII